ncbi:hypothetical protein [Haematomicrobium sanguinis]|uniref:hypothetical protein n=1 Tax=Haematomicrobium sanguinis TaxID=479106 RepID=UPI00068ABAB4|nr:hypothetical protein [Haematomicrobium sanguinis]
MTSTQEASGPSAVPTLFVLTINQRDTATTGDRVDDLIRRLEPVPARIPFSRTVGDETTGVLTDAQAAVDAALLAIRSGNWNIGIGVGSLYSPLPETVADAEGYALVFARRAVNAARRSGTRVPLAVAGPRKDVAGEAQALMRLLGQIVRERSEAEWRVIDLLVPGVRGQQEMAAQELGATKQAVSKALTRSQWAEEWEARPAAARLLALVDSDG